MSCRVGAKTYANKGQCMTNQLEALTRLIAIQVELASEGGVVICGYT